MQWADYNSAKDNKKEFKDEEQVYNSYTPQYAGPLRIPPANFQPRVRKETSIIDTTNSRYIENWNTALPIQQVKQFDITKSVSTNSLLPNIMDMAPLPSRTDSRDFRQSQPYIPSGPNLSENPFFDRYDPTRDPKNMVREVRSAVYEIKDTDRGIKESERIRQRTFADRYEKEGETPTNLTQWFDLLRPKIDNPEIVYRNQSQIWKLGEPVNQIESQSAHRVSP